MKIAVYTISLNEEKFVHTWADSAKDADCLLIADTGSSDHTVNVAATWSAPSKQSDFDFIDIEIHRISIQPWRFDLARNAALALLPADIDVCITLDMDEILTPGWREELERVWKPGETTLLRYGYVWNWNADGTPGIRYMGDRIHARSGYSWKGAVHEVCTAMHGTAQNTAWTEFDMIHHHADPTKSRSNYLPLLELATAENPNDDRAAHYLGREYMFQGRHEDAIRELGRHLALPTATWKEERAASMRFLGRCNEALGYITAAAYWFFAATRETPDSRDCWYEYAKLCMRRDDWALGIHCINQAIRITDRPSHYLVDPEAWGAGPYDVGSVCAHYAGQRELAREWWLEAARLAPLDERIRKNGEFINQ